MPTKEQLAKKKLKEEWVSKIGTVLSSSERRLARTLEEFDTDSAESLELIEQFGAFRDVGISIEEDHRSGERCDDAPIVKAFRIKEFEARMMLQDLSVQEKDGFKHAKNESSQALKQLKTRLKTCVAGVKAASQAFKSDIRSVDVTEEEAQDNHAEAMEGLLTDLVSIRDDALALINKLRRAADKNAFTVGGYRSGPMEVQAGIWRDRWLEISKAVNTILASAWSKAESKIRSEMVNLGVAAAANEPWEFDYIGSLAKGVKGPPKQHIAFDADKFDVDANLEAPCISTWAIQNGSTSDRDRLWGLKDANLAGIAALKSFQQNVHQQLCELEGYDQEEEFEVVVKAEVSEDDEMYELAKSYIIQLKHMTPDTLLRDFKARPGVSAMLDSDGVPLPARAADLFTELSLFGGERSISFDS